LNLESIQPRSAADGTSNKDPSVAAAVAAAAAAVAVAADDDGPTD